MPLSLAYIVGIKSIQYTVRGVSERLDAEIRAHARKSRQSINAVLVKALAKGMGSEGNIIYRDLDALADTWCEDPEFDHALEAFDVVDEELWK